MNKETKKQTILGYLFLIPSLAVFAVFMFYPLLYTFYLSFFEWNMVKPVKKFVGLNNYIAVFRDPNTFKILGNTLAYILVLLVPELCAALYSLLYPLRRDPAWKEFLQGCVLPS